MATSVRAAGGSLTARVGGVPGPLALYAAAIAVAEGIRLGLGIVPGLLAHAGLVFAVLMHFALASGKAYRRALPVLGLVPLLRVVSFAMPLHELPAWSWYALTGAPVLVAALLLMPLLEISLRDVGLGRARLRRHDLPLIGASAAVSLVLYQMIRPAAASHMSQLLVAFVAILVFSALMEEVVFRALPRAAFDGTTPESRRVLTSFVWAVMYVGSGSAMSTVMIGIVGYFYAWALDRSGSLFPAVLAHAVLKSGLVLVWPLVVG